MEKNGSQSGMTGGEKRLLAVCFCIAVLIQCIVLYSIAVTEMEHQKHDARSYGEALAANIELSVNNSLNTTRTLENLYREFPNEIDEHFDSICERMMRENPAIGSLYIAPYDKIQYAYPESVRSSTIGFEARKDPNQGEKAILAVDTKSFVLAGPYNLIEGGVGFIIRNPMFDRNEAGEDEFIGFTVVIMDWDRFVQQVTANMGKDNTAYDYAVWKEEDLYALTDSGGFIFKSSANIIDRELDIPIRVPNDTWHITVQPAGGYQLLKGMQVPFIMSCLIVIALMIAIYFGIQVLERRRRLELAMKAQEEQTALADYRRTVIQVIHETLHSGMWGMDFNAKGEMISVNWSPEFRSMIGFEGETDFPNTVEAWSSRLHPDDKERVPKAYYDTIQDYTGEKSYDVEYRFQRKDGVWHWYHAMGRLTRREDGSPRAYIGLFVDITPQKQTDELLHIAVKQAEEANRAKSEFLSNMSHDIRTPMNAIVGMTAIAVEHIDDRERVQDCLRKITLSSKHLLGLINDVLDMAKIESGKMLMNMEALSLRQTMETVCDIIRPQIRYNGQNFDIFVHNIISEEIFCDSVRLNQVLLNFLSNAMKFTPKGGSIYIYLEQEEIPENDKLVRTHFSIRDTGMGMTDEFKKKLFRAFEREDNRRVQKTQGTGLGLTIVKHIVDAMGGAIDVESTPGEGTTFHVTLDLEKVTLSEEDRKLPDWKILVVDDNADLRHTAEQSLLALGTKPETCGDGESAIQKIREAHESGEDFFAVLLDYKMHGMNGVETAKRIREILGDGLPINLISAYDWSDIEDEAKAAGVNGFLAKPLFRSTLYYALKRYMDGEETVQEEEETEKSIDLAGMQILLAEDMDVNAEIAIMILEESGAHVDRAEDGKIAKEKFEASPEGYYDVILMDLRMPNMNGYESCEAIRSMKRGDSGTVPIIAMTADAFAEDAQKCLAAGMNAHVAKPIDLEALKKLLARYIKRKKM